MLKNKLHVLNVTRGMEASAFPYLSTNTKPKVQNIRVGLDLSVSQQNAPLGSASVY